MKYCELSTEEKQLRRRIAENIRAMIKENLNIQDEDGSSLVADYCGYYLQISFSDVHPLMMLCLAKGLAGIDAEKKNKVNDLNLNSILGSHAINDEVGCYSYRATQWLDLAISPARFFEILDRCVDEAARGYRMLTR